MKPGFTGKAVRVWLRRGLLAAGVVVALFAVLIASWKQYEDAMVFSGYDPELALDPVTLETASLPSGTTELVEITGLRGERIPLRLMVPANAEPPYRCVVFLYGIGQQMGFFHQIVEYFAQRGIMLVVPEQYNRGLRRQVRGVRDALKLRARSSRIVPETRRVVDYLLQRGDVDPERLDLVGASYGGIMGCAAMRHEPRFRSAVIALAGGGLPGMTRNLAEMQELGPLSAPLAGVGAWLVAPFEPLRHVGEIAPRPMLFQNLEGDELIPCESADRLHAAAGEPKTRQWMEASHIHIRPEDVEVILVNALDWLDALDHPGRPEVVSAPAGRDHATTP